MGIAIQGTTGPYPVHTAQGYGANTAANVLALSGTRPELVLDADIFVAAPSPTPHDPSIGARVIQGALGYAGEEIRQMDRNGDGTLDRQDVAALYGGNAPLADAFIKARDVDDDGRVSRAEEAAHCLFELNPTGFINTTLLGYAQHAPTLYSPEQRQWLNASAQALATHLPTQLKPYSTGQDRRIAEHYALAFPAFTRETLRGIVHGLSLDRQT